MTTEKRFYIALITATYLHINIKAN